VSLDDINPETNLPGPLDVLLRDLHTLWCQNDCADDDPAWHMSTTADPERAASLLCQAIWDAAKTGTDEDRRFLKRMSDYVAGIGWRYFRNEDNQ
jgi:hypothetical protein